MPLVVDGQGEAFIVIVALQVDLPAKVVFGGETRVKGVDRGPRTAPG